MRNLNAIRREYANDPPRPACEVIQYLCDLAENMRRERDVARKQLEDLREVAGCADGQSLENKIGELRDIIGMSNKSATRRGDWLKSAKKELVDTAHELALARLILLQIDVDYMNKNATLLMGTHAALKNLLVDAP